MKNKWQNVELADFSSYINIKMPFEDRALSNIYRDQFTYFHKLNCDSVTILAPGISCPIENADKYNKIYLIDINENFLNLYREKHKSLPLYYIRQNLCELTEKLPHTDILTANLIIEHIGYKAFKEVIESVSPLYVSIIMYENGNGTSLSSSPYTKNFDCFIKPLTTVSTDKLNEIMNSVQYSELSIQKYEATINKYLIRIDYKKQIPCK